MSAELDDDWRDDLCVFPVRLDGKAKIPMVPWREQSAPWDEWTGRWPNQVDPGSTVGVGIDCAKSHLVVLDDDDLGAVERWLGYRPETFRVRTPRQGGGMHYYFRAPEGVSVRNRSSPKQPFPGVDVRGDGGFVVAAGSMLPDGNRYAVEEGHPPIPLPLHVLTLLSAKEPAAASPGPSSAGLPEVIRDGARNQTLFDFARTLVGKPDAEALPLLREAWSRCEPPYTEVTAEQMWARVSKTYATQTGCGHPSPCPSEVHHARLEFRIADEWARSAVASMADPGTGFVETALAGVGDLPPPIYFGLGDGSTFSPETKIVRAGDLVLLHGMNAAGKSPTLDLLGIEALRTHDDALWVLLDYELGAVRQRARLIEAGLTEEEMETSIFYVQFPPLLTDGGKDALVKGVLDKAERYDKVPRLLTWDTYSRSCSRLPNADPERNQYVNAWFTTHPDWASETFSRETGVPLTQYVTDHSNKGDGIMPGGGHAKQDRVVTNIWLRQGPRFGKDHERGSTDYVIAKYGHGEYTVKSVVARLRNRIDADGVSRFYVSPDTKPGDDIEMDLEGVPKWALTERATDADVLADLAERGPIAQTKFCGRGRVGQNRVAALERLEKAGLVVSKVGGGRGSPLIWSVSDKAPGS